MKIITTLTLALTLATLCYAQNEKFSIEDVLSSSFPSSLTSAPKSARIVWLQNAEGVRNIWLAEAPDYKGRMVTDYDQDDGQVISNVQFTPDEKSIIYVRGGAPNNSGEIPNPTLDPGGNERAIWIIDIASSEKRKLAEGSGPEVSPSGDVLAFLKDGQVWNIDLNDEESKPKKLFTIRGRAGSLAWSPDGSALAFVSNRKDHGYVGIYKNDEKRLTYLDPSVDHDSEPAWSPDGGQVAFIRRPNEDDILPFTPRRTALPWSIHIADVNTGKSRQIWKAREGTGSAFRRISTGNQLLWGADNQIVFPYEGDGWTHLYTLNSLSGDVRLLTPGAFEVQFVSLSPDGRFVIYDSNENDSDRKHIWKASVSGGKTDQITSGVNIEWAPVVIPGDQTVAYITSGPSSPAQAVVLKPAAKQATPLDPDAIPKRFPSRHLITPRQVFFSAADGMKIHGQLFIPKDTNPGQKHPAVLFFHGGSRRQMLLGFHHRGYYHNAYSFNQYLVSKGYVVLSVNYRSGIGYGMEFREALNYGARGASEFNDVMGAGLYLRGRPDVDPDKIGLWGGSYGGFLTAMGLAKASDLFAAGVDLHGVHDWNIVIRNFVPTYDAGKNAKAAELAFESSPMAYVDTWKSPVLLIHGDDDRNVPFSESVDLAEALRRQGVAFEQLIFPDEVHGFLLHASWIKAYKAAADFFDRKLK